MDSINYYAHVFYIGPFIGAAIAALVCINHDHNLASQAAQAKLDRGEQGEEKSDIIEVKDLKVEP